MVKDGILVLMEREPGKAGRKPASTSGTTNQPSPPEEVIRGLVAATGKEIWRTSHPCGWKAERGYTWGPAATPAAAGGKVICLDLAGKP